MVKPDFDIRYDRRVSAEFLSNFELGGFAHSLVTYARKGLYPLDFQLRADPKTGSLHATLYAGLTAVLQVFASKDDFRLRVHKSHQKEGGFNPAWLEARPAEDWIDLWPDVELYLERIIPKASASHGQTEGAVQAAVSSYDSKDFVVIDREVTPHFRDADTKKSKLRECQAPILEALGAADLAFGGKPKSLGSECDALAIDKEGTVLAIEVKPCGVGSIAWVAAQALMYSRVLEAWIAEPDEDSQGVLRGMLHSRQRLGLASSSFQPDIPSQPKVRPVVALQRGASPEMVQRMLAVRDALHAAGLPKVEIFEVSLVGELIPLSDSRAEDGTARPISQSYITRANAQSVRWKLSAELPTEARAPGKIGSRRSHRAEVPYVLPEGFAEHNLLPNVRHDALALFDELGIPWHQGKAGLPTRHLRSSQVQCVNALMPMVTDAERIRRAFGDVLDVAEVRDFGEIDPSESGRYLTFEYVGPADYLHEGKLSRGANRTSIDAAFAYRTSQGVDELALVEWKFTESYPSPASGAERRFATRASRYSADLLDPSGPIDCSEVDLGDLFHEPIYQLVRQQLLAWHLEKDSEVMAECVRVVHVLSPENTAYERSYRAPSLRELGVDVSSTFERLLRRRESFHKLDPAVFLDPTVTSEDYGARYRIGSV